MARIAPTRPAYGAAMLRTPRFALALLCITPILWLPSPAHAQTPAPTPSPTNTPATTAPAKTGAVVGDRNTQLNDRIPPAQQLQLQAGDDKFAGRYIADLSANHRGAVIVVHDSGQHHSWPLTVAALLDELPLFGWNTLAIELPAPAQDATTTIPATPATSTPISPVTTPAAAAGTTPAAPAATTALITGAEEGIEKQAQARIDGALKKLMELDGGKPQPTMLIGFGSGAWRAVEFARRQAAGNGAQSPEPLRALVLVDPRNRLAAGKADLPTLLPTTELATLDIVQNSEALVRADAEARRRAVLHQKNRIYQRLELPPLSAGNSADQTVLVKRIRSWLQRRIDEPQTPVKKVDSATAPKP
ncbi:MAG: DUF3530 family protein [Spongiibacteraceae bacterium]